MMGFTVLAMLLSGSLHRTVNIIASLVFVVIFIIVLIDGLDVHSSGRYNLMMAADVVIMLLAAWFAFRLPRRHGSTPAQPSTLSS